jgi:L-threonylcarbamoyladenylate synthase
VPQIETIVLIAEKNGEFDPLVIDHAAALLQQGKLVAFPTETVYGLGADATQEQAVQAIFKAKGRPANNPLIVHFPDAGSIAPWVKYWPKKAELLAEKFWPGPLTMILPVKEGAIAPSVLAGGKTIGVRVPAHPVAIALLKACGCPLAAPSANKSTNLSPTNSTIVLHSLQGRINAIVDGGSCPVGIESTVLDLSSTSPRILRPGMINPEQIEAVLGKKVPLQTSHHQSESPTLMLSPGQLNRHYAPQIPLYLVDDLPIQVSPETFTIRFGNKFHHDNMEIILPLEPTQVAEKLYWALHMAEISGAQKIIMELPPKSDRWVAIHDRLSRASHV